MWPDRVSNLGPLTYELGALPTALHGPTSSTLNEQINKLSLPTMKVTLLLPRHFFSWSTQNKRN